MRRRTVRLAIRRLGAGIADGIRSPSAVASLLRGTAGSCLNRILANGLMFIAQIVLARHLGHEDFGIYTLALAWLGILVMVGRLGYDLATVRFVATYQSQSDWSLLRGFLFSGRTAILIASVTIGCTLFLGAELFRTHIGNQLADALNVCAFILPTLGLVQLEAAAVRGLGRVVLGDLPFSIIHPLLLVGGFLVGLNWFNAPPTAETALVVYFGATLLVLASLMVFLRRELPAAAWREPPAFRLREWLTTAPAMMLIAGFGVVLNQSSTIVVGMLSGAETAGTYGAAARIASILQIIVFSLVAVIGPLAARLSTAGEQSQLQRAVDVGVAAVFVTAVAAALVIGTIGKWLLALFGPEFVSGYDMMMILVAGQICAAVVAPAGILLNMTGHQNASAWILATTAVANLVLCTLLTMWLGPVGAASATAFTTAGFNAVMAVVVYRRLGLRSWISITGLRSRELSA